jgi:methylated-DNA-[protein]-cysteine S-methyltransferase
MNAPYTQLIKTPLCDLLLVSDDGENLAGIYFDPHEGVSRVPRGTSRELPVFRHAEEELAAYLAGTRAAFTVPTRAEGTPFQLRVWDVLKTIPYGETATYGDVAKEIGQPNASRAVGMANNRNPISIVVPCHRVIGRSGELVGYGGGLDRKKYLLALESKQRSLAVG